METNMMKIGSFAPQGMNPASRVVILLSFSLSNVLVAIIAGTEHPKPIKRGMKDRPLNPNRRKILSITKATRAIYPLSSKKLINRYNTKIRGRNPRMAPSPSNTPSTTRL
jgi:hypothetical protein